MPPLFPLWPFFVLGFSCFALGVFGGYILWGIPTKKG